MEHYNNLSSYDRMFCKQNTQCILCILRSLSQAVRSSIYGRPGACYVDIAGDMVNAKIDRASVR